MGVQRANGKRRLAFLVCGSAVLLLAMLGFSLGGLRHHRPVGLVCDEPTFNFGSVPYTIPAPLEHRFVLWNTTDHPIRIVKVDRSCGCTTPVLSSDMIAAGKSADVLGKYDWVGKEGQETAAITLTTDDKACPKVVLTVSGYIAVPVTIYPRSFDFGELEPGPSEERILHIAADHLNVPFKIQELTTTDPAIQVRRIADGLGTRSDEGPGEIGVRVVVPRKEGIISGAIQIKPSVLPGQIWIPITVRSRGAVTVIPPSIAYTVGSAAGTEPALLSVRIHPIQSRNLSKPVLSFEPQSEGRFFTVQASPLVFEGDVARMKLNIFPFKGASQMLHVCKLQVTIGEDAISIPIVVHWQ